MSEPYSLQQHLQKSQGIKQVKVAVCTVSDSRSAKTDQNKTFLSEAILASGHILYNYCLVKDNKEQIEEILEGYAKLGCQVAIFNGGTGLSKRDRTFDALSGKIEKPLPGFGELFRMLSFTEIGSAAMLSRAMAGVYRGILVFSVPGSPAAVQLAWNKLIEPQLKHLVWELER